MTSKRRLGINNLQTGSFFISLEIKEKLSDALAAKVIPICTVLAKLNSYVFELSHLLISDFVINCIKSFPQFQEKTKKVSSFIDRSQIFRKFNKCINCSVCFEIRIVYDKTKKIFQSKSIPD